MLLIMTRFPSFFVTEQYSIVCVFMYMDFPGGSDGKESACDSEDPGSIPG